MCLESDTENIQVMRSSSAVSQTVPGYPGCLPGPKLIVSYNDLVKPPSGVQMKHISANYATVTWSLGTLENSFELFSDSDIFDSFSFLKFINVFAGNSIVRSTHEITWN